jgi:hypothetical protein
LDKFLISIPKNELTALFNGLVRGDGHTRKDDQRIVFIQKNKETKDWFQIMALRLGYHSIQSNDRVYLTKRTHIGIRKTNSHKLNMQTIKYNGKIWCPKTQNGTWVARRNGRIFVTGNTFAESLVKQIIDASCPEKVCDSCGLPIDHTRCECENPTYHAGLILDPFGGSGTVGVVAKRMRRNYALIDNNSEYIAMAEARIKEPYKIRKVRQPLENQLELKFSLAGG